MIRFDRMLLERPPTVDGVKLEAQKVVMDSDILKELIDKKRVDSNAADQHGDTVLMYTVRKNATESVKVLLDHGADVNAVDNNGKTALMFAALVNDTVECAKLLIAYGADIDARDNDGTTALVYATSECMRLLVDNGADVNAANKRGVTALMRSAGFDTTAPMEALLDHGADVNACTYFGMNALFYAVCQDKLDSVRLLINKGIDINRRGLNGETVLMRSVRNNPNPACIALLIAHGADINAENSKGENGMSLAFKMEAYKVICILAMYGANVVADQLFAIKGKHQKLGLILEKLKRPNLQQQVRRRIYQHTTSVCQNTHSKAIDALIKGGKLPTIFRSFMLFEDDIQEIISLPVPVSNKVDVFYTCCHQWVI
ncbi:unnamed protein product [Owenia fusiformis]|uniref:Uncharacterized protein n=1 Tax=Owenia fusiformis TaxID=6347 RepID=A0A8J1TGR1_OWEFU|nr:unnamed protein product [Owenia fusiformis]